MIKKETYVLEIEEKLQKELTALNKEVSEVQKDMVKLVKAVTCGYFIQNDSYGKKDLVFEKDTDEKAKNAMTDLNSILLKYS